MALVDDPKERHRVLEAAGSDKVGEMTRPNIRRVDPEQVEGRGIRPIDPALPRNFHARESRGLPPRARHLGPPPAVAVHIPGGGLSRKVSAADDGSRKQASQPRFQLFGTVERRSLPKTIDVPPKGGIRARNRDDAKSV